MPKAEQPPRATRAGARATHKNRFFILFRTIMRDPNILFPKVSPMHSRRSVLQRTAGTYFPENNPEGIHSVKLLHDPLFPLRNLSAGAEASFSTLKRNAPEMELPQVLTGSKKAAPGFPMPPFIRLRTTSSLRLPLPAAYRSIRPSESAGTQR